MEAEIEIVKGSRKRETVSAKGAERLHHPRVSL